MTRNLTPIDAIAQKLISELPPSRQVYPGEMHYVSTGARLIECVLKEYFKGTGAEPPQLPAIKKWFYNQYPDWAIAILHHAINTKKRVA